jgi:hypothetical protein
MEVIENRSQVPKSFLGSLVAVLPWFQRYDRVKPGISCAVSRRSANAGLDVGLTDGVGDRVGDGVRDVPTEGDAPLGLGAVTVVVLVTVFVGCGLGVAEPFPSHAARRTRTAAARAGVDLRTTLRKGMRVQSVRNCRKTP